jgi:NAD(P)-dependent dehydrogenase (short-subunit alcohol dehydrogenase family)
VAKEVIMDQKAEVVVITGASAGLGRATARLYGRRHARVGLLARGRDGLEAARHEIELTGGQAIAVPTDVSNADQVEAAAQAVEDRFGSIDIWINNAMISVFSPIRDTTAAEFQRVTEVTYLGYVYGTLAALRRMLPRDHGVIVQVGSALAYRGIPLQAAYCGAKHALQGFLESVRTELAHDGSGIRVTMVQLPAINTPQFDWMRSHMSRRPRPVPPVFSPDVAARAVLSAVDRPSKELLVGWPTVRAVAGNALAPWFVDRVLTRVGYDGQATDEPEPPSRPDNLFRPVELDVTARGRFTAEEREDGLVLSGELARGVAGFGIVSALAGAAAVGRLSRS